MGTASNLSELTVTCRQCGSASMERLGAREYRCNHCGAITVVSQDPVVGQGSTLASQGQPVSPANGSGDSIVGIYPGPPVEPSTNPGRGTTVILWIAAAILTIGLVEKTIASCNPVSSPSPASTTDHRKPAPPPVPASQLALSPAAWMTDPTSSVSSGKYVSMLYNHSPWPIQVPRYTMTLYTDGIRGASASSEAPLPRLLPGEYEPVSFAFETPNGSTRTEVAPPSSADRADGASVSLPLTQTQLVREDGRPEYRLVGLVQNNSKAPVKAVQVLVMLFGTNRTLIGYGTGYARAMRPGEQVAFDIHIPTANVQPVLRYEYLVDAAAEDE
ncbi:FxLYD domain-containing protein [Terriglobus sp.]|uniref:FxLYD domain-containing protein n=1 Tax=Terriglobus sp. TaxID=1889013 RepID=UPI003B004FBF